MPNTLRLFPAILGLILLASILPLPARAGYIPAPPSYGFQEAYPNFKVAAILVTFPDNPAKPTQDSSTIPWTKTYVDGTLFSNTYSMAAYFNEVSNGQVSVTGTVFDNNGSWYTVAQPSTVNGTCSWDAYFSSVIAAADADIDYTQYNTIMVFSPQKSCASEGLASDVNVTEAGNKVYGIIDINGHMGSNPHHELGHLMNFAHANSWQCNAPGVITGTNCRTVEYGDRYNIMGASGSRTLLLTAQQLENYGWLPAADVTTVSADGDYTIRAYELHGALPRVLKIPQVRDVNGNVTSWYWLEYRQPNGFDNVTTVYKPTFQELGAGNGVLVHMGNAVGDYFSSTLLDMTPGSMASNRDIFDPALPLGSAYADTAAGVSFGVLARTATTMTIRVKFSAQSLCAINKPSLKVKTIKGSGKRGQEMRYDVTVKNASVLCGAQRYELRSVSVPKGWQVTIDKKKSSAANIVAGQSKKFVVRVVPPKNAKYQKYAITLEARRTTRITHRNSTVLKPVVTRQ